VAGVFSSVAKNYDVMNDLMSAGLHRLWKRFTIGIAAPRPGERVLDVAGGTADLSSAFFRRVGAFDKTGGQVWLTDINNAMLTSAATGCSTRRDYAVAQCDAEKLPFPNDYFDIVTVAFGLRNMTHKDLALAEMRRVLRPGDACWCWNFPRSPSRLLRFTTYTRSRYCPGSGEKSPATRNRIAIWPNRSACIPIRQRSRP